MYRLFGTLIRQLREKKKLSQNEASKRAGITQSQWSRLEDGFCWPTENSIGRVGIGLGIPTPEHFFKKWARFLLNQPHKDWKNITWEDFLQKKSEWLGNNDDDEYE